MKLSLSVTAPSLALLRSGISSQLGDLPADLTTTPAEGIVGQAEEPPSGKLWKADAEITFSDEDPSQCLGSVSSMELITP